MKKNKMMRLASSLLVAVLLTTSVISGTFAKYTTSGNADDSARVAKWGVTVVMTGDDVDSNKNTGMFNTTYTSSAGTTVNSADEVLAPGTGGSLGTVTIKGQPEVMVDVTVDVDLELAGWIYKATPSSTEELYFPVVVTIGTTPVDVTTAANLDEIELLIEKAVIKHITGNDTVISNGTTGYKATVRYDAQVNLDSNGPEDINISWEWPIETAGNNAKDTYLGDKAAAGDASQISFSCTVTVDQVD